MVATLSHPHDRGNGDASFVRCDTPRAALRDERRHGPEDSAAFWMYDEKEAELGVRPLCLGGPLDKIQRVIVQIVERTYVPVLILDGREPLWREALAFVTMPAPVPQLTAQVDVPFLPSAFFTTK